MNLHWHYMHSPKKSKIVFILHRDRWKYVTYCKQAAQRQMGLDSYCKFKQNQETTKIAFVSFQFFKLFQQKVQPNNFYPKIFTWMQNYLPFGHKH